MANPINPNPIPNQAPAAPAAAHHPLPIVDIAAMALAAGAPPPPAGPPVLRRHNVIAELPAAPLPPIEDLPEILQVEEADPPPKVPDHADESDLK